MSNIKQPTYFFVGPMKTATSLIYDYFNIHEEVAVSQGINELFFYDKKYHKGYEWYLSKFSIGSNNKICIDVSPSYFSSEDAMTRIKVDNAAPKVIITLRDPVLRSLSHIRHLHRYGEKFKSIPLMVKKHPEIINSSMYSKFYNLWCEYIGEDNVILMDSKKLKASQAEYFETLCGHLSVNFHTDYDFAKKVNVASSPASPCLAKLSKYIADKARALDLSLFVEVGKALGLKNILYTGGQPLIFSDYDMDYLSNELSHEVEWYNSLKQP